MFSKTLQSSRLIFEKRGILRGKERFACECEMSMCFGSSAVQKRVCFQHGRQGSVCDDALEAS